MVMTVVFMVVLLGFAALVIDVGSWYRAHRSAQATADASALAGAAVLPDTAAASALANQYATKNGGSSGTGGAPQITFTQSGYEMDTIKVKVTRPSPGFFARVFGSKFMNVTVSGSATARAYNVQGIQNGIAPITVNYKHPLLNCSRGQNVTCNPTFGTPTQLSLEDIHSSGSKDAAGAFGLINLNGVQGGNVGAGTLADWLTNGYHDHDLTVGDYDSVPGATFNNSTFTAALDQQIGHELLFPVYRLLKGPGSNAKYTVIGWVGFHIDSYNAQGSTGTINGHFTRYTTDGIPAESGNGGGAPGLGVHKVELTN
jgi:hypothetical protein